MSLRHVTRRNTVDLSGAATFVHPLRGHLRLTDIDNTCTLQRIGHVRLMKGTYSIIKTTELHSLQSYL
jgi:hypothetical protein